MRFIKASFRIIIGILFGVGAAIALLPAFAAFNTDQDSSTPLIIVAFILLSGALGLFAPTIRRGIGRGFLLLGASVFALPISTFLLSGRVASEVVNSADEGSEAISAVGAGIAGVAVTGFATFVGVIVGTILLIIGLILCLGGRREVIVIERSGHHG